MAPNKCHTVKREAALVGYDAGLAKREAVVTAIIEKMKEEMLRHDQ